MRDKEGLPVKGLSSADFALREDNTPQKIVSVEEHSASGDAIAATPTVGYTDGTVVASNKPPEGSVWNVLLIDLYNTPNEARGRLQSQLEQFLKQLPEHQPVAVVTMLSHIKIETSFQDGAAAAYQYLRKNGWGLLIRRHRPTLLRVGTRYALRRLSRDGDTTPG